MDDALRCEPSRIVIGESLGDEAFLLLEAMSAGHAGCVPSIHARSAREALTRLMIAAMKAPHHPPERLVQWMIAANIDLVIHLEKRGEARLVTEVIEVDSHLEGDHIPVRPLWQLDGRATGPRRRGPSTGARGHPQGGHRVQLGRRRRDGGMNTLWVALILLARWGVACSRRSRTAGIHPPSAPLLDVP